MKIQQLLLSLLLCLTVRANMFAPETLPPAVMHGAGINFIVGPWYMVDNASNQAQTPSTDPSYKGRFWPILIDTAKSQSTIYFNYYCTYPGAIVWAMDWHTPTSFWTGSSTLIQSYNFDTQQGNTTSWTETQVTANHLNPWYKFYINDTGVIQVLWRFKKDSRSSFLQGKFESPMFVPVLPPNVLWVQRTVEGDYIAMSQAAYSGSLGSNPLVAYQRWTGPSPVPPVGWVQIDQLTAASNPIPQTRVYFVPVNADGTYKYTGYQINLMGVPVYNTPHNQAVTTYMGQEVVVE